MKKRLVPRFISGTLALFLLMSAGAMPACADETNAGIVYVSKNFLMDSDAFSPHVDFTFSLCPGEAAEATKSDEINVFAGIGEPLMSTDDDQSSESGSAIISFDPYSLSYASDIDIDTGEILPSYSKKFLLKTLSIDFSGIDYGEPGIYRYYLEEEADDSTAFSFDVTADEEDRLFRTIDVYVQRNAADDGTGDGVSIGGITVYEGKIDTPIQSGDGSGSGSGSGSGEGSGGSGSGSSSAKSNSSTSIEDADYNTDTRDGVVDSNEDNTGGDGDGDNSGGSNGSGSGSENQGKPATGQAVTGQAGGYVNEFLSESLTIKNEVKGNQGRSDKYFLCTVTIKGLNEGDLIGVDTLSLDYSDSLILSASNYTNEEISLGNTLSDEDDYFSGSQLKAAEDGTITHQFYLRGDQSVSLLGVPRGAEFLISLNYEDYTISYEAEPAESIEKWDTGQNVLNLSGQIDSDTSITFINEKTGTIPTGVALPMLPYILTAMLAIFIGILLIIVRKKEDKLDTPVK